MKESITEDGNSMSNNRRAERKALPFKVSFHTKKSPKRYWQ